MFIQLDWLKLIQKTFWQCFNSFFTKKHFLFPASQMWAWLLITDTALSIQGIIIYHLIGGENKRQALWGLYKESNELKSCFHVDARVSNLRVRGEMVLKVHFPTCTNILLLKIQLYLSLTMRRELLIYSEGIWAPTSSFPLFSRPY